MLTNEQDVEQLITECLSETEVARREKYDGEKAERTAALFLSAQLKLSYFIEDIELGSKLAKNEVSRVEAEKYFHYKSDTDKKLTEVALTQLVAKDPDVILVKKECAEAEARYKKWNYVLSVLKDSHIFFRTIGKKQWSE